jgi:hypothetical protein
MTASGPRAELLQAHRDAYAEAVRLYDPDLPFNQQSAAWQLAAADARSAWRCYMAATYPAISVLSTTQALDDVTQR